MLRGLLAAQGQEVPKGLSERPESVRIAGQAPGEEALMKIGLIDVDGHNFPNLALMKLSAWHKAQGDIVEWWHEAGSYDCVYMAKVFDETYSPDIPEPTNAVTVVKGGTGYGLNNELPEKIEHIYPDYSIYPENTKDTAYGFLTRGCPRDCPFCIVSEKEGRRSRKVADLSEWWRGQRHIELLDPNILACTDHLDLLKQLAESRAVVNYNQGLDIRLMNREAAEIIGATRVKRVHFAWDNPKDDLRPYFERFTAWYRRKSCACKVVYVLTNFNSTINEDLHRIYTLRDIGYDPYVMVYNKPYAPKEIRQLQRWVNNKRIFRKCKKFEDYKATNK